MVDVRPPDEGSALRATSRCARCLAALCAAAVRASTLCDRSHHTVAFCFRMRATYEVGLLVAVDRPEVDRRGKLDRLELMEVLVGCRCTFIGVDTEELRECEGGARDAADGVE
jgi:hypothetical protein